MAFAEGGGACKLPADRLNDRQQNGWAPRGNGSRYFDGAVGAEILLDAFGVCELVAIRDAKPRKSPAVRPGFERIPHNHPPWWQATSGVRGTVLWLKRLTSKIQSYSLTRAISFPDPREAWPVTVFTAPGVHYRIVLMTDLMHRGGAYACALQQPKKLFGSDLLCGAELPRLGHR